MATAEELIGDAGRRMDKSVEHAHTEFNTVRTGRASAALLDRITVDYYGTATPLKQLATISVPEPIRLPVPQLTEERRKELVKIVGKLAEEHRIAVRDVRRDALRHLQELVKKGEVGDDDERRAEKEVQELTDKHTKTIDELVKHKEAEILEV